MSVVIVSHTFGGVQDTVAREMQTEWLFSKNLLQSFYSTLSLGHCDVGLGFFKLVNDLAELLVVIELWDELIDALCALSCIVAENQWACKEEGKVELLVFFLESV